MEEQKTIVRTQSAFVNKLYKMLEDMNIRHLISWSEKGDTFSVSNPTLFSKTVLPQYFKHNNWQSFVRQLNMYGFHKVNDMIHTNPDNQTWEFKHPNFKKGAIDDLQHIKRKINSKNITKSTPMMLPSQDEDIYGPLYKHVLNVEDRLTQVSQSYEILKSEMDTLKSLMLRQQETISEFTHLFTDVLQDKTLTDLKRDSILCKVNQLQSLFTSNTAYSSVVEYSSSSSISSSNSSITSETHCNNNVNNRSIIQKMRFGKESHLLNPEE